MPDCADNSVPVTAPVLSFVIPYYNVGALWLRRCLDSISNQGIRRMDYEVIVADDGSVYFSDCFLAYFTG